MQYLFFFFLSLFGFHSESDPPLSLPNEISTSYQKANETDKLKILCDYCKINAWTDAKKVSELASHGLKLAQKAKSISYELRFLHQKGISESRLGHLQGAKIALERSLALSEMTHDTRMIARSSLFLGNHHSTAGDYSLAKKAYLIADSSGLLCNDLDIIYGAKLGLGNMANRQADFKKAEYFFLGLIEFCKDNNKNASKAIQGLATTQVHLQKPSEALSLYLKAKGLFNLKEDYREAALVSIQVGNLLEGIELDKEALPFFEEANAYFTENEDIEVQSDLKLFLGQLNIKLGNDSLAEIFLLSALELKENSDIKTQGTVLRALGELNISNNLEVAKAYLDRAQEVNSKLKDSLGLADTYLALGKLFFKNAVYDTAQIFINDGLSIYERLALKKGLYKALTLSSEVYEKAGDFKKALSLKKASNTMQFELVSPSEIHKISRQLQQEDGLNKEQEKSYGYVPWIVLVIGLGLLFWAKYLKTNKKEGKKQSSLPLNEANVLAEELDIIIRKEAPFLDEELTLTQLAHMLGTSDKKLSMLLNQHLNTRFYDYVNGLRLERFKEEIVKEENKNLSVVGMAFECGFKSKSTFYKLFKEEMGMSPSVYLKVIDKEKT